MVFRLIESSSALACSALSTGVLPSSAPALDHVLGTSHRGRGIERDDLADDQVVKEHADGSEMLLHARR